MKANTTTNTPTLPAADVPHRTGPRRAIATAVIALLALSACTSDPGPKRVAEDIIKAESLDNPDLDEECLLDRLDEYTNDELVAISDGLEKTGPDQVAAEDALAEFQADLETCLPAA